LARTLQTPEQVAATSYSTPPPRKRPSAATFGLPEIECKSESAGDINEFIRKMDKRTVELETLDVNDRIWRSAEQREKVAAEKAAAEREERAKEAELINERVRAKAKAKAAATLDSPLAAAAPATTASPLAAGSGAVLAATADAPVEVVAEH